MSKMDDLQRTVNRLSAQIDNYVDPYQRGSWRRVSPFIKNEYILHSCSYIFIYT